MCADAIDIFTFLRARGIGQGFALFYEAWAALLERKEVCLVSLAYALSGFLVLSNRNNLGNGFGCICLRVFAIGALGPTCFEPAHFHLQICLFDHLHSHTLSFNGRISRRPTRSTSRAFGSKPYRPTASKHAMPISR